MVEFDRQGFRYGQLGEVQQALGDPPTSLPAAATLNDAAALLVQFDGLEQRLKISFAETVIALALDDFEEYRADRVLGEDLEKDSAGGIAVDQDAAPLEFTHLLLMAGDARVDAFVIGGRRVLELDAKC